MGAPQGGSVFVRDRDTGVEAEVTSGKALRVTTTGSQPSTVAPTGSRVTATDSATLLIAANTSRRNCIIENLGANPVALGYTNGVTFGNAAIILPQYAVYELLGAEGVIVLAVYGICDAGLSSAVGITELA